MIAFANALQDELEQGLSNVTVFAVCSLVLFAFVLRELVMI